jgi:hypothetical protein
MRRHIIPFLLGFVAASSHVHTVGVAALRTRQVRVRSQEWRDHDQVFPEDHATRKKFGETLAVLVNAKLEVEEVTEPTVVQLVRFELVCTV